MKVHHFFYVRSRREAVVFPHEVSQGVVSVRGISLREEDGVVEVEVFAPGHVFEVLEDILEL